MKIIEEPQPWSDTVTCKACKTIVEVVETDLQVDRFVDNSKGEYWFMGHEGREKVFLSCPTEGCKMYLFSDCPEYIKNRVKARTGYKG